MTQAWRRFLPFPSAKSMDACKLLYAQCNCTTHNTRQGIADEHDTKEYDLLMASIERTNEQEDGRIRRAFEKPKQEPQSGQLSKVLGQCSTGHGSPPYQEHSTEVFGYWKPLQEVLVGELYKVKK